MDCFEIIKIILLTKFVYTNKIYFYSKHKFNSHYTL